MQLSTVSLMANLNNCGSQSFMYKCGKGKSFNIISSGLLQTVEQVGAKNLQLLHKSQVPGQKFVSMGYMSF